MPLSQTEYLWSGATPLLLISPARFFLYKGPKIDYFLTPPLDYRLLFNLVSTAGPGGQKDQGERSLLRILQCACQSALDRLISSALRGFLVGGPPSPERRRCDSRGGPAPLALRSRPWATRSPIRQVPHVPTRCAGRSAAGCKGGGA